MRKWLRGITCMLTALGIIFSAGCSVQPTSTAAERLEVRNNGTAIQWKYSDETDWHDLVALTELRGAAGENGKDGANGENGIDGKNGINGKDGINGVDGKDGADGKNGKTAGTVRTAQTDKTALTVKTVTPRLSAKTATGGSEKSTPL